MKSKFLMLFMAAILCFSNLCPAFAAENNSHSASKSADEKISASDKEEEKNIPTDKSKAKDALTLSAASAILIDAKTGSILYEKDAYSKQYPASITKLMTILLALEKGSLDDKITFSHDAVFNIEIGSAHIGIQEGETLTLEQVLYGIMLRSANECANAAAEYVDGSLEKFAKHMTKYAKELGCKNTNFVNANGLFDENHYTTAYDMALIAKKLLENKTYRSMMSETYYLIPPTEKQKEERYLHGQHQMLNTNSLYYYEGATGGKTGYTTEARNTLVTYAEKDGTELIAVVFQCEGAEHYVDTKTLFDYGFTNFKTVKALSAKDIHEKIDVTETYKDKTSIKDTIPLGLQKDVYATIPIAAEISQIKTDISHEKTASVPVKKGDALGTLTLSLDGKVLDTVKLIAEKGVAATTDAERAAQAKAATKKTLQYIGIIASCVLLVFFVIFGICRYIGYRNWKKRHAGKKYNRKRKTRL